jgi:nucleoside-diphosphate-sugar epimerase
VLIVVTGATGFVGRALVTALVPRHDVVCLVRNAGALVPGAVAVPGDLTDRLSLAQLPGRPDAVVHLAQGSGGYPEHAPTQFEINAAATSRLLDYAGRSGAGRFVFTSTGTVYAPSLGALGEESALDADPEFYVLTKRVAERLVLSRAASMSTLVLRLFAPYGPGQRDRLVPRLIDAVRTGASITLRGGGSPRLNPIWIDDLVEILEAAVAGTGDGVVNVAGPKAVGIRDIALIAGAALGREPRFVTDPTPVAGDYVADTTRMRSVFGARALVEPDDGIARLARAGAAVSRA